MGIMLRPFLTGFCLFAVTLQTAAGAPSPEVLLLATDSKDAYTPCAAYGKDVFLVAWQSGRLAEGDLRKGMKGQSVIIGQRISRAGQALDAKPFLIGTGKHMRQAPRAAFGGGVFLVVWQDLRNGKDWDIYAARVSPEGRVLDQDSIPICTESRNQALPRISWDGSAFLVVWQDFRSTERYEVYGTRVSPDGKVLDGVGNLLASGRGRHRYAPAVAHADNGKSLVLWNGDLHVGTGPIAGGVFVKAGLPVGTVTLDSDPRKQGPGFEWVPMCLGRRTQNLSGRLDDR